MNRRIKLNGNRVRKRDDGSRKLKVNRKQNVLIVRKVEKNEEKDL